MNHLLAARKAVASKVEGLRISKGDKNLQFSQLMGMAHGLSLGLRNNGFQVSKYLPFFTACYAIINLFSDIARIIRQFLAAFILFRSFLFEACWRILSYGLCAILYVGTIA